MFSFLTRWFRRKPQKQPTAPPPLPSIVLTRGVVLNDGVWQSLIQGFEIHRLSARGEEEIGWLLMGTREGPRFRIQATLPAGAERVAGVAHVRFHEMAQAFAARILSRKHPELRLLGVAHTHPGSLRRPSGGDYQGDRQWIQQLPGKEGVFAIGTADARPGEIAEPHRQIEGPLVWHWFSLAEGERDYESIPVSVEPGPDLAAPLHPIWGIIEPHAAALDRLAQLHPGLELHAMPDGSLRVELPLWDGKKSLTLLLTDETTRYYVVSEQDAFEVNLRDRPLDRAVYLILAELALREESQ